MLEQIKNCERKLWQLAANQSLYAKTHSRSIRITFTRYHSMPIAANQLKFQLDARCSTYREIGILYVRVMGMIEIVDSRARSKYAVRFGMPTNRSEFGFVLIWNLVIILIGIVLLMSTTDYIGVEKILRYSFLPLIYGIYVLRLRYMFTRVKAALPDLISRWCNI